MLKHNIYLIYARNDAAEHMNDDIMCVVHRHGRTFPQLLSLREAARMVPNCAQLIILAYGTCASAKISRHSAGAWLYRTLRKIKINVD